MTRSPDLRAIGLGIAAALAIAIPTALLAQVVDRTDRVEDDTAVLLVLFGVVLAGLGLGGFIAGSRRPDAPLTHAAAAAVGAYVVAQTVAVLRLLAADDDITWAAMPFFALLAAAAGMTGGLIADHRARR